ncbi:MAG: AraC family transcriptional regulator [Deltaproteobacteria bacterium]|nr:AraC family transcriptional regulator [Deltaproteobacteria bacterium]
MPEKESTSRDYRERINRVIFHIESHLDEKLDLQDLAKVAFFSPFHFHRIFTAFTDEPLGNFIRRLRLERSSKHLLHLAAPVTEVALTAGYETPAAFTRAFSAHFGVSPTEYRKRNKPARMLGAKPLDLTTRKEKRNMKPEIRNVEPMPVLFVRRTGPYSQAAGEAFGVLCQFAGPRGLLGPTSRMIGISHDDPHVTAETKLRYDACVTVDHEVKPEGEIGLKTIAGGGYAIFVHSGPYELFQRTYDQIFKEWLPDSGKQLREEPCFEMYMNDPHRTKPEDLRTEIWLPIQ